MDEPSLLDYLKAKLAFWRANPYDLFLEDSQTSYQSHNSAETPSLQKDSTAIGKNSADQAAALIQPEDHKSNIDEGSKIGSFPWRAVAAAGLAFLGQYALAPRPDRDWTLGAVLLIIAAAVLVWSSLRGELHLASKQEEFPDFPEQMSNIQYLLLGTLFAVISFFSFSSLEFGFINLALISLTVLFTVRAFWTPGLTREKQQKSHQGALRTPPWDVSVSSSTILAVAAIALVGFFRFYRLVEVPPEMNSDHAEKILDILSILNGRTKIYFSNNGGREALQFYLVAGLHSIFGLPLGFTILKIVTSVVGFLALPFIYLLGKELGGIRVGLLAFLFAGIAYWPNVVARVGLRLPFYMFFSAAVLYFLVRGLKRHNPNDCILAGIYLGLSMYGYAADRILPLLVVVIIVLFMLHNRSVSKTRFALTSLLAAASVSLVIFVPLLRYIVAEPHSFFMRMGTRMGSWEQQITESPLRIFLENNLRALAMFSWDAGVVWPISIPGYPALSTISGGFFYLGFGLVLLRFIKQRAWSDIGLLLAIPILMLPSTLSIAFPGENPNLYRTGGAIVPVFLLIALAADSLMSSLERSLPSIQGKRLAVGIIIMLLSVNAIQDYNLVFKDYFQNYQQSAWNSSEMGNAARGFIGAQNLPDNVWVVGYPNWVDTRLVAVNAGFPGRDYELKVEAIGSTIAQTGPKLFILKPEDTKALETLQAYYPLGWMELYPSSVEGKDFLTFFTPPEGG